MYRPEASSTPWSELLTSKIKGPAHQIIVEQFLSLGLENLSRCSKNPSIDPNSYQLAQKLHEPRFSSNQKLIVVLKLGVRQYNLAQAV
jgi:hypothetical protein